jgi:hypothetical protein
MEWVQQTTATTMLTELRLKCWNQKAKRKTKKNTNERMSLPP